MRSFPFGNPLSGWNDKRDRVDLRILPTGGCLFHCGGKEVGEREMARKGRGRKKERERKVLKEIGRIE